MARDQFQTLFTRPAILSYLTEHNLTEPTPVQKQVPAHFAKLDLSVLAPTGSGKTLSYLLPLFDHLKTREESVGPHKEAAAPLAVILSPTRELSKQITDVCKGLAHHVKIRVRQLAFSSQSRQENSTLNGAFEVLVASPSKLNQYLSQGKIQLKHLQYLILDEADQMLDMGFSKDLQKLCSSLDEENPPRVHLFSATAPLDFAEKRDLIFQRVFKTIAIERSHHLSAKVETYNIYLSVKEKRAMLETFLQKEAKGAGVIFVNDKAEAESVYLELKDKIKKPELVLLHGQMTAQERKKSHQTFKEKKAVLIATDIVARGIDLPELAWVLNYDLPWDPVYYIHRSGRVGRRGGTGLVYNFVTTGDLAIIEKINKAIQGQTALELKPLKLGALKSAETAKKKAAVKKKATAAKHQGKPDGKSEVQRKKGSYKQQRSKRFKKNI